MIYKIGSINSEIAKSAGIMAGYIKIDDNHIKHIIKRHEKELESLGLGPLDFVKFISKNFNQIRKANKNALYLIVYSEKLSKVAVIEFEEDINKKYYKVLTATPMSKRFLDNKKIIWSK